MAANFGGGRSHPSGPRVYITTTSGDLGHLRNQVLQSHLREASASSLCAQKLSEVSSPHEGCYETLAQGIGLDPAPD
jgi:hypothetical protein